MARVRRNQHRPSPPDLGQILAEFGHSQFPGGSARESMRIHDRFISKLQLRYTATREQSAHEIAEAAAGTGGWAVYGAPVFIIDFVPHLALSDEFPQLCAERLRFLLALPDLDDRNIIVDDLYMWREIRDRYPDLQDRFPRRVVQEFNRRFEEYFPSGLKAPKDFGHDATDSEDSNWLVSPSAAGEWLRGTMQAMDPGQPDAKRRTDNPWNPSAEFTDIKRELVLRIVTAAVPKDSRSAICVELENQALKGRVIQELWDERKYDHLRVELPKWANGCSEFLDLSYETDWLAKTFTETMRPALWAIDPTAQGVLNGRISGRSPTLEPSLTLLDLIHECLNEPPTLNAISASPDRTSSARMPAGGDEELTKLWFTGAGTDLLRVSQGYNFMASLVPGTDAEHRDEALASLTKPIISETALYRLRSIRNKAQHPPPLPTAEEVELALRIIRAFVQALPDEVVETAVTYAKANVGND